MANYREVLSFWFEEATPEQWFKKDLDFDKKIIEQFGQLHEEVTKGEHGDWRDTVEGRLAEIIVLDQFSRNIYRDDYRAFRYDEMALALAQEALKAEGLSEMSTEQRIFLYMPFMHSESKVIHEEAMVLFTEPGMENNLEFEKKHKRIIDRFGRYPHRNKVLGRKSTEEEIEFLKTKDSSF